MLAEILILKIHSSNTTVNDTERWTTCYGKLRHLTSTIGESEELLSTANNTDAPKPKHLLGNLVDAIQIISCQSSSLLETAISAIAKLDVSTADYIPMEHDPTKSKKYCLMQINFAL